MQEKGAKINWKLVLHDQRKERKGLWYYFLAGKVEKRQQPECTGLWTFQGHSPAAPSGQARDRDPGDAQLPAAHTTTTTDLVNYLSNCFSSLS